jgi:hypothetical protein
MRVAAVAAALVLLVACAFPDGVVRKRASDDFPCPEDQIVVHRLQAGWLARGCKKEADYVVQDGRALRTSEITRAKVDERPELPIDRVPGMGSIGLEQRTGPQPMTPEGKPLPAPQGTARKQ